MRYMYVRVHPCACSVVVRVLCHQPSVMMLDCARMQCNEWTTTYMHAWHEKSICNGKLFVCASFYAKETSFSLSKFRASWYQIVHHLTVDIPHMIPSRDMTRITAAWILTSIVRTRVIGSRLQNPGLGYEALRPCGVKRNERNANTDEDTFSFHTTIHLFSRTISCWKPTSEDSSLRLVSSNLQLGLQQPNLLKERPVDVRSPAEFRRNSLSHNYHYRWPREDGGCSIHLEVCWSTKTQSTQRTTRTSWCSEARTFLCCQHEDGQHDLRWGATCTVVRCDSAGQSWRNIAHSVTDDTELVRVRSRAMNSNVWLCQCVSAACDWQAHSRASIGLQVLRSKAN